MRRERREARLKPVAVVRRMAPGVAEAQLEGRLDLATSDALRRALDDALAAVERLLVLDLGAVVFMDSVAMGQIIRTIKRLPAGWRTPVPV